MRVGLLWFGRVLRTVGEDVVKGEVEEGDDDDGDGLGDDRLNAQQVVERELDDVGEERADGDGDVEAGAANQPGARMAWEVAESEPVVEQEAGNGGGFRRDDVGDEIVRDVVDGELTLQDEREDREVDHGGDPAGEQEGEEALEPVGATVGQTIEQF